MAVSLTEWMAVPPREDICVACRLPLNSNDPHPPRPTPQGMICDDCAIEGLEPSIKRYTAGVVVGELN